jgi:hypothetical protein
MLFNPVCTCRAFESGFHDYSDVEIPLGKEFRSFIHGMEQADQASSTKQKSINPDGPGRLNLAPPGTSIEKEEHL